MIGGFFEHKKYYILSYFTPPRANLFKVVKKIIQREESREFCNPHDHIWVTVP